MAAAAVLPILTSVIPGIGSIFGAINSRNAVKRAGTTLANTATGNAGRLQDTLGSELTQNTAITSNANQALAGQVGQGQDYVKTAGDTAIADVAKGTTDANAQLANLLNTSTTNLQPYLTAGATAANRYQDLLTNPQDLSNTPGYQFQLQQGLKDVQQTAAGSGALQSGGTLKALTEFGQGLADTTYQQALQNALAGETPGIAASGLLNQAQNEFGVPQAENTLRSSLYAGNTTKDVADKLASMGIDWAKTAGNWDIGQSDFRANLDLGTQDKIANWLWGGANATAGSQLGSAAAGNAMFGGTGTTLQNIMKAILAGGGSQGGGGQTQNVTFPYMTP